MASSPMQNPTPWGGAYDHSFFKETLRGADTRTAAEDRDGRTSIMDDGIVCILFDD